MEGFCMSCFSNKSGCELVYLASSFALSLSQGLSSDEILLLGIFLTTVGDNLSIIGTQRAVEETESQRSSLHIIYFLFLGN